VRQFSVNISESEVILKVTLNPISPEQSGAELVADNRSHRRGVPIVAVILLMAVMGLGGFLIGWKLNFGANSGGLNYATLNEVYNTLAAKYDGKLDKTKLIQGAAAGMAAATGDPYTVYMTASEAKSLTEDLSGEISGIGVQLGTNSNGLLEVVSTIDDSPAKSAGLQPHDIIAQVNGEDSSTWTPDVAATKIRGDIGTTVKLSVVRGNETKDYSLTRAEINNPSVTSEITDQNVGYLRISSFSTDTVSLATEAANKFKAAGVKGIVLDLRGNSGGYVDAAQGVVSLWLSRGTLIAEEKTGDKVVADIKANGSAPLKGIKTVVLIDGGSASASEITAGALRDHGAATLMGTKSYGKGCVQEMVNLSDGAVLKVTIANWYTPKGANLNGNGLTPDKTVEMTAEQYNSGNDVQKTAALDQLTS
jgi:carboxyl-terminal processing protease